MDTSQDNADFYCQVCNNLFEEPRLLKCGHTFCMHCLKNVLLQQKDKLKLPCPTCNGVHKLDKTGVDGLARNQYLESLVSKVKMSQQAKVPLLYSMFATTTPAPTNDYSNNYHDVPNPSYPEHQNNSNEEQYNTVPTAYPQQEPMNYNNDHIYPQQGYATAPPSEHIPYQNQNPSLYPSLPPQIPSLPAYTQPLNDTPAYYTNQPYPAQPTTLNPVTIVQPSKPPQLPPKNVVNTTPIVPPQSLPQPQVQPQPQPHVQTQPTVKQTQQTQEKSGFFGKMVNFLTGADATRNQQQVTIPNYFAPFSTDIAGVYPHFKAWVSKFWFAPSDFDNKMKIGSCIPAYIPFWVFSADALTQFEAHVCHMEGSLEKWTLRSGTQTGVYTSIVVCGDMEYQNVILQFIHSMNDYDANLATSPNPYLCGNVQPKLSRTMTSKVAFNKVTQIITRQEEENCRARLIKEERAKKVEQFKVASMQFKNVTCKLVYQPAFVANYFYDGKEYKFVMNGQTKDIKGERPYGLGKIGSIAKSGFSSLNNMFK